MTAQTNTYWDDPRLEIVADIRDQAIRASIEELHKRDRLTIALRTALNNGVTIDSLSEASGLAPSQIRSRIESGLVIGDDLEMLAGNR